MTTEAPTKKLSLKGLDARIDSMDNTMVKILEIVQANAKPTAIVTAVVTPKTEAEKKQDAAVDEAGPVMEPVNPHWKAMAQKTIGSALDHCEVSYPKNGGTIFTVVIKEEFSNAPADYLKMYKADRRSKDVSAGGIQDVELWCKLVAQNLKRNQKVT